MSIYKCKFFLHSYKSKKKQKNPPLLMPCNLQMFRFMIMFPKCKAKQNNWLSHMPPTLGLYLIQNETCS
jgi:hypothetical protein